MNDSLISTNLSSVILKLQYSLLNYWFVYLAHVAPICTHILFVFNQNVHFDVPTAVQKQHEYFPEAGEMPAAVWKA